MADKITKRLPEAELEIMLIVWDSEGSISSGYILERFKEYRDWALPTLMTVLTRLVKKGYLDCKKNGRNNSYSAIIKSEEYLQFEAELMLKKVFGGSYEKMTKTLLDAKCISKDDVANLAKQL